MKNTSGILILAILMLVSLVACNPKDSNEPVKDVDIKEIHRQIKEELGEDYLPDMSLSVEELQESTQINKENIEEFIAEVPMISIHVDTFIAVEAVEGKGGQVEKTLEDYRTYLNDEALNYPANVGKLKSAKVVRHGDYVFFIMVGRPNDIEDQESQEALEFSQEEVKRVETVIDNFFE